jgi:uncharacterized alkaline shock family protein YloU
VREVARITTLATPGVLAMADRMGARGGSTRGGNHTGGVEVAIHEDKVQVRLRVIAAADISLRKLGQMIQTNVAGAVAEIAGMTVTNVDVTFEDVRSKG